MLRLALLALLQWVLSQSQEILCTDGENCDSGFPQQGQALLGVSATHRQIDVETDESLSGVQDPHPVGEHHVNCMYRAVADCTTDPPVIEEWREQECHEPIPGCKGSAGWCDCNGNLKIDDWEVAFNCSGKNNYSSLLE